MIVLTFIIIFVVSLFTVVTAMSFGLLKLLLFIIGFIFALEAAAYLLLKVANWIIKKNRMR